MADQSFWQLVRSKQVAITALKVALLVGSILALINYSDKLVALSMQPSDWIKLGMTYLVPYAVSTFSAVKAIQSRAME